jgi:alkylation response protein AidB-like acyl-CoA dehydrogenase
MNLQLSTEDERFLAEVRAFLHGALPEDVRRRALTPLHPPHEDDRRWWNRQLYERGWAAPSWPVEYGGCGWSPLRAHLFEQACCEAGAPELRWQGLRLFGPVLYTFGTAEQKARYLPGILRGDTQWAQGFSEPGAGSDLASLKTSAVRDGAHYIVSGQKIWTSEAHYSEMGFFLVRTDASVKPQAGLSMLIIDLRSPGVTVRPITMLHGDTAVSEIFLDQVRVPAENLLGEPGSGWTQAKFLLGNERTGGAETHHSRRMLRRVTALARTRLREGRPLIEDARSAARIAAVGADLEALEWSVLRVLCGAPQRWAEAAVTSALKVRGSEIQQRVSELGMEILGFDALRQYGRDEGFASRDLAAGITADLLYQRASTIMGGAREVQKNIIAKLAFGL